MSQTFRGVVDRCSPPLTFKTLLPLWMLCIALIDPMSKRTRVTVKILEGKDLLVSDLLTGTSDPMAFLWVGSCDEGEVDLKYDKRVQVILRNVEKCCEIHLNLQAEDWKVYRISRAMRKKSRLWFGPRGGGKRAVALKLPFINSI